MSQNQTTNEGNKKPTLIAWHVRKSGNGKGFWTRVGAAWTNRDGGFTIQLDCIPLDGRIVCQPPKEQDEPATETPNEA